MILGSKHSGKRSLIDSLFDISKTTLINKRQNNLAESNKMRLKGITTAVDYAYLNVMDINDPDNRTLLSMKEHTQSLKSIWSKKSIIQQYIVSLLHLPFSKRHSLLSCLTSPILGTSYRKSRSGFGLYTNCKKWLNWV